MAVLAWIRFLRVKLMMVLIVLEVFENKLLVEAMCIFWDWSENIFFTF